MSGISAFGNLAGSGAIPLPTKADEVMRKAASAATANEKIEKSAKEFESILLGSWLQQAEQSFGSLPGGDDDDDADAGKEQFQGMAMQSLGTSMTASGGIGIALSAKSKTYGDEDYEIDKRCARQRRRQ